MGTEGVRTCVSCAHFKGQREAEPYLGHLQPKQDAECLHPQAVTRELIYGKALCQNERAGNKGCGKKGALWEPRK